MEEHDMVYINKDIEEVYVKHAEYRNEMIILEIQVTMKNGSTFEYEENVPSIDFMLETINDGTARLVGNGIN